MFRVFHQSNVLHLLSLFLEKPILNGWKTITLFSVFRKIINNERNSGVGINKYFLIKKLKIIVHMATINRLKIFHQLK